MTITWSLSIFLDNLDWLIGFEFHVPVHSEKGFLDAQFGMDRMPVAPPHPCEIGVQWLGLLSQRSECIARREALRILVLGHKAPRSALLCCQVVAMIAQCCISFGNNLVSCEADLRCWRILHQVFGQHVERSSLALAAVLVLIIGVGAKIHLSITIRLHVTCPSESCPYMSKTITKIMEQ